ncbi:conserved hypothetical protein [Trichinella spiralis]|uniref:hypothetical protein n=1 Tax=Trichinella spiralis TaxID=6334 RepID=UPI0001EFDD71|nr:conserved hypothetical protein [Trichinella spiralis]
MAVDKRKTRAQINNHREGKNIFPLMSPRTSSSKEENPTGNDKFRLSANDCPAARRRLRFLRWWYVKNKCNGNNRSQHCTTNSKSSINNIDNNNYNRVGRVWQEEEVEEEVEEQQQHKKEHINNTLLLLLLLLILILILPVCAAVGRQSVSKSQYTGISFNPVETTMQPTTAILSLHATLTYTSITTSTTTTTTAAVGSSIIPNNKND